MVILHHTDCGITDLAAYPEMLAEYFGIPAAELESKAVMDPRASVAIDVDIIKQALPPGLPVSGLVYDVHTGLIETVVPPAAR
jgi:carbonic anhydrase